MLSPPRRCDAPNRASSTSCTATFFMSLLRPAHWICSDSSPFSLRAGRPGAGQSRILRQGAEQCQPQPWQEEAMSSSGPSQCFAGTLCPHRSNVKADPRPRPTALSAVTVSGARLCGGGISPGASVPSAFLRYCLALPPPARQPRDSGARKWAAWL